MAECELIDECPFFRGQLTERADEREELKEKYCKNNNLNCARYMIASSVGKEHIPPNLYPDEKIAAYAIIAEKG